MITIAPQRLLLISRDATGFPWLHEALQADFVLQTLHQDASALRAVHEAQPALVLLDMRSATEEDLSLCHALTHPHATSAIRVPVLLLVRQDDEDSVARGLSAGAADLLTPSTPATLIRARVQNQLAQAQAKAVQESRWQVIQLVGRMAEYRDDETGQHVVRVSHHAKRLALQVGYHEAAAQLLFEAAPMHDIGKIGISDSILLKPGPFEPDEWAIMKRHCVIGAKLIGEYDSPLLVLAASLARSHHERFDGSGYPDGLKGEAIPHAVRILSLVDVFDALLSTRPYKQPWPLSEVLVLLKDQRGRHFDPALVDALLADLPAHLAIQKEFSSGRLH